MIQTKKMAASRRK